MNYKYIGDSGLRISSIAFGIQTFGWNTSEADAKMLMSQYHERGGNYSDAADSCNDGESGRILGNWMTESGNRNSSIVGTKVFFKTGSGPNDVGLSRKNICQTFPLPRS